MNEDEDYDYEDGEEITDCPNCNSTYDDADQDFLICSKCGWDAEKKRFKPGNIDRGWRNYGIDPEVTHRRNRDL